MIDFVNLPQTEVQMIAEYLKKHPKTNADRIRSMTDMELAKYLYVKTCEDGYPQFDNIPEWLNWLKQECADESN